jgi:hypothetical protein
MFLSFSSAMFCLKNKDLRKFIDIMNNIPDEDLEEARPLPASHWINQPVEVSTTDGDQASPSLSLNQPACRG